jgi:hypothetical protein
MIVASTAFFMTFWEDGTKLALIELGNAGRA